MHNKVIKVFEVSHDESVEMLTFTFMFQHLSRVQICLHSTKLFLLTKPSLCLEV